MVDTGLVQCFDELDYERAFRLPTVSVRDFGSTRATAFNRAGQHFPASPVSLLICQQDIFWGMRETWSIVSDFGLEMYLFLA